jgi:hypothetical protein
MKWYVYLSLTLTALLLSVAAFAQIEVPEVNEWAKISEIIFNWKSLSPALKGSGIALVVTQLIKQAKDFESKRLVLAIVACFYAAFQATMDGSVDLGKALTVVIVSYGGAQLIYEGLKPFLKKIKFLSFLKL